MDGLGKQEKRFWAQVRAGARPARLLVATGAIALAAGAFSSTAGAETFGQIGAAWGTPGSAAGQLFNPAMLGVDSIDGSVYSGEEMPDGKHFRIQKFSSAGAFKAKVELPLILKEGGEEKVLTLHGIAVDPVLHRLYLIEGCAMVRPADTCKAPPNIEFGAKRILVFSTEPKGSELVPAEVPTLKLPEGEDTLYTPESIAVDPSNHDLVVLGENIEERATVQRISSAGTIGARFVDTGNELRPVGKEATSIAVGPDGTTYTLTGSFNIAGSKSTRAWQLPKDLSHAEKVPGFDAAAEAEGWATGLLAQKPSPLSGGPQLAVSPDGGTLYWKESLGQGEEGEEEEDEPDNVLVRGYSFEKKATQVLYGNGEASCQIQTSEAGIGAVGKNLVVFDYGPEVEEGKLPAYGDRVLTFGPGGGGCRAPVAKFTVNGSSEAEVEVIKGGVVTFDASGSEMLGTTPSELDWNFGDGPEEKVLENKKTEEPAKTTITHKFVSGGTYTVTLKMKLAPPAKGATGNPLPVIHAVKVPGSGTMQKLTVAKTGTGLGTVIGSPAGIGCGSDCEQEYEEGKEVTLSATASTGSKFTGWSLGSCPGTTPCKVTMSAAKEVKANFDAKPMFKLTVAKTGTGTGAVTSSPSGIDCRKDCAQEYEEGKVVTLTAHLDKESELGGWTGCQSESEDQKCIVTMSATKEVKANLVSTSTPKFQLTVEPTGTGSGTVTGVGIACPGDCAEEYFEGEVVTLSQKESAGSAFKGWTGCESEPEGKCKVTMSAAKLVKAKFDLKPKFKLTVEKTGTGAGTSTVTGTGIDCGVDCSEEYLENEVITLSQKPSSDSNFKGWTGCESEPEGKCKVTMSAAKLVKAKFDLKPKFKLTVTKSGTGSGAVTSSPAGINCGGDCEEEYSEGEVVTLSATPATGSKFVAWTGACAGAGACKVTMSAVGVVNAEFAVIPPPPPEEKTAPPEEKQAPPEEKPPVKKLTPKQKALAKCKKLKGKARAKCIKKANAIGRHKKPHHRRRLRGHG